MRAVKFHLDLQLRPFPLLLDHAQSVLLAGSCFSTMIGQRLACSGFTTLVNPHGILYHPFPLSRAMNRYAEKKTYDASDLVLHNGLYHSMDHHGSFSGTDAAEVLRHINGNILEAHGFLRGAGWLILTLGSAFYVEQEDGTVVGNCHKMPSSQFQKKLASVQSMVESLGDSITRLRALNSSLKVIVTVSPVRYLRDGVAENTRSKARLVETAHLLAENLSDVFYFPAFELVNDDLRDYRFYGPDLVHPTEEAADYVFGKFCDAFMSSGTRTVLDEASAIHRMSQHRLLHPGGPEAATFTASLEQRKKEFLLRNPAAFLP